MRCAMSVSCLSVPIILFAAIVCILPFFLSTHAAQLSFEVQDRSKQCFYEKLKEKVPSLLEYQVIIGGNNDIDVVITDPQGQQLYAKEMSQTDKITLNPQRTGVYKACFSNEFSSVSHKYVFLNWEAAPEEPVKIPTSNASHTFTLIETATVNIYESLNLVESYQTHARNREASHRLLAEELNWLVMVWSMVQACVIMLVGCGQVFVLRSFFSAPSPRSLHSSAKTVRPTLPPR